jgi:hypothetical protein
VLFSLPLWCLLVIPILQEKAQQCTQAACDTESPVLQTWRIQSSNNELGGDVLFCKGGALTLFDVPIGSSYQDRGMRNDSHNCFGIALTMPLAKNKVSFARGAGSQAPPAGQEASSSYLQAVQRTVSKKPKLQHVDPTFVATETSSASQPAVNTENSCASQPAVDTQPKCKAQHKQRAGPRNCFEYGVKDVVYEDLMRWYKDKLETETPHDMVVAQVFKHLSKIIFKNVKVKIPADVWSPGASQPWEEMTLVVSEENTALCVKQTV